MSSFDQILSQLIQGIPLKTITTKISKERVTSEELVAMLDSAKKMQDSQLKTSMLRVLFSLAEDDWYRARVLVVASQQSTVKGNERLRVLASLKLLVSKLEQSMGEGRFKPNTERNLKILTFQYYFLLGETFNEQEDVSQALENYEIAGQLAKVLSATQQIGIVEERIQSLRENQSIGKEGQDGLTDGQPPIRKPETDGEVKLLSDLNQEILVKKDSIAELDVEISTRKGEVEGLDHRVEELNRDIERLEQSLAQLTEIVEEREERSRNLMQLIREQETQLQEINEKIKINEVNQNNEPPEEPGKSQAKPQPIIGGLSGDVPPFLRG